MSRQFLKITQKKIIMIPKSKMPHFFYDVIDNLHENHETEIMIDFFMSWTLRCAAGYDDPNKKVEEYSRKILFKLLEKEIAGFQKENIIVKNVKTWKQWSKIDVLVEVKLEHNNKSYMYVIVLEDKLYTNVHSDQLERYKKTVEEEYEHQEKFKGFSLVLVYITNHDSVPNEDKLACDKAGYTAYTIQRLREEIGEVEETGNYLFDEFWFRYNFYDKGADFTKEYQEENFVKY